MQYLAAGELKNEAPRLPSASTVKDFLSVVPFHIPLLKVSLPEMKQQFALSEVLKSR